MTAAKPIEIGFISAEAFATRVVPDPATGCHNWRGKTRHDGYGVVVRNRSSSQAHRVALILAGIDLPVDAVVDHLCRNRRCVNPAHLDVTTSRTNTERGISPIGAYLRAHASGRCINGHDLAIVGFHRAGRTKTCAQCGRDRVAAYKARRAS